MARPTVRKLMTFVVLGAICAPVHQALAQAPSPVPERLVAQAVASPIGQDPDPGAPPDQAAPPADASPSTDSMLGVTLLPFEPPPQDFDWIQLPSDEWLKGEIKAMYDKTLDFDSDELGLLTFDWADIKQLWSHGPQSLRLEGADGVEPQVLRRFVKGVLRVVDDRVVVITESGAQEFDRAQLVSIAPGAQKEIDKWAGDISLGANFREGNSNQVDYSARVGVKRRTAASRLLVDYLGNINKVERVETANNHRLTTSYDKFLTKRYFWRQVFGEWFRDPFQNISSRWIAGSAFGYTIIDTAKTEWDLTIGGGLQYIEYDSVEPGEDKTNTSPLIAFSTLYDTELTSWIDFDVNYSFYILDEESGSYTHHFISTLSTDLVGDIDFDVSFVWDRIEDPQPQSDGTVPKQDDFRLIVGLGYDF